MTTLLFTGDALAVNKRVRITKGSVANYTSSDIIKIGLGNRYISMAGWSPNSFIDSWSEQGTDPFSDVVVTTDTGQTYLDFTTASSDIDFELSVLVNDAPLAVANEVQQISILRATGGTFTITYDGQTTSGIAYNASAATIQTALEALSNIAPGDVTVALVSSGVFSVTFGGVYAGINVPLLTVSGTSLTGSTAVAEVASVRNYSAGQSEIQTIVFSQTTTVAPQNEKQTIKINNNPTSGTFTLTYSGQTTSGIAYNASAATIQTALEALSNIAPGDVIVSGGPFPNRMITVEFAGTLAATNVDQLTSSAASLGSTTSNLTTATSIQGSTFTTKPKWVINTTGIGTASTWNLAFKQTDIISNTSIIRSANFAQNANAATVKTALTGELSYRREHPTTGLLSVSSGNLFHADEITVTNSVGSSDLTIELSESAWERLNTLMPLDSVNYPFPSFGVMSGTLTTFSYTGTYTAGVGSPTTERQELYPLGVVPTAGTFNLDFSGTNTGSQNLAAGIIEPAEIRNLLNTAITPSSSVNTTGWYYIVNRINTLDAVKVTVPFEAADFTGPGFSNNTIIYLLRPFAADTNDSLTFGVVTLSNASWADDMATLFNDTITAYELERNRIFNSGGTNITPGTSTGAILIAWNSLAVNQFGNKALITVEDSGATATITHATTVVGGSTSISSITGGTFALSITTPTTTYTVPNIPYNATAAEVATAINNFFGSTVVTTSGGPLPLSEVTLTFTGLLGNLPITTTVIPSFLGTFSGSLNPTITSLPLPPEDRSNTYRLTIAPGRSSLSGPNGRIVLEVTTIDIDGNTGSAEISLALNSLSAEAIEEGFTELFGKRVVHVVEEDHLMRHEKVTVTPYSSSAVDHRFWFWEDRFLITFLYPFELAEYVTSFRIKTQPSFAQLFPDQTLDDNDNDTNDLLRESYRVWFGFKTANDLGTPKHRIALDFVGTQALNTMEWNYVVETQYATSNGTTAVSRRGVAEALTNQQMRFLWVSVNEEDGTSGDEQPTKTYTPLARTPWIPLSSEPVHIKHVLERLLIHFTATPSAVTSTLEDVDDAGTSYTPTFFGIDNVEVTGSLLDSWLDSSDPSRRTLKVRLVNKLAGANFNFYQYSLVIELNTGLYGMMTPTEDSAQPSPRVFTMTTGKVFQPGNNLIVRYDFYSTADMIVTYNGVSATITSAMSRREIQSTINSLSTVGRLLVSDSTYNQDADVLVNTSPRYYITGDSNDLLVRPSQSTPIVPHKLARSVTVNGTLLARQISLEMSGNGFQYSSKMPIISNTTPDSLFTLTTTQEGISAGAEIQQVSISNTSTPPTSGTFKLNNGSSDTSTIAYNATATQVAAAVTALGSNWVCNGTGGPLPLLPVTLTFTSAVNIDLLTVTNSTLKNATVTTSLISSGGYDGSLIVTEPVRGYGPSHFDSPENWSPAQAPSSQDTLVFDEVGTEILHGLRQSYSFSYYGSDRLLLSPRRKAFHNGQKVYISTTGTLPSGLSAGYYYIRNIDDYCTFQLSSTANGSIIAISSFGSGVHTVQLRELTIKIYDRYPGGQIGLPFTRSTDLREYLCPYLTAGFTLIEIGINTGLTPTINLAKFNTLSFATEIIIHETSSSRESNVPTVCLLTNNTSTTIVCSDCELGLAIQNGETSNLSSIDATNSSLVLRNTTVQNDLVADNTTLTTYQTSIGNLLTSN
ncbi:hypothetical protein UFOVP448_22 [uncultured Caudovirales phage]|uniref:Uncharacterized protein n=1 Tax=uncultured Caudovirales phage TaxID=2100421 RepID=A0A6J5M7F4_9CAUD|nr:hypothetical protein UFOVP448_22 [uncultured Caudovirales phage]